MVTPGALGLSSPCVPRTDITIPMSESELLASPTMVMGNRSTLKVRKCRLLVVSGPSQGKELVSDREVLVVGCHPGADLVLEGDRAASRSHCEIRYTERGYLLVDLESTNGTFLDGRRVERAYLSSGSQILAGQSTLAFSPVDEELTVEPDPADNLCGMVGRSLRMRQVFGLIRKIAPMTASVLVQGETGTGKELVAHALHELSPRKDKPLVVIDCGAIPPNLIESELFGHEKGAFTGADRARPGAFERAHGGTVFLDELGELRLDLQPKLLRALENHEVRRVGGDEVVHVDVRVVAATNRDLVKEIQAGNFREDLFFRLSALAIELPPLRARTDDIPLILRAVMGNAEIAGNFGPKRFTPAAMSVLQSYGWPGNIRELVNVASHVLAFTEGIEIDLPHLPARVLGQERGPTLSFNEHLSFKDAKDRLLESFEREYLGQLLKRCGGNISRAARESGMHRKSIERLVKKYQLDTRLMRPRSP